MVSPIVIVCDRSEALLAGRVLVRREREREHRRDSEGEGTAQSAQSHSLPCFARSLDVLARRARHSSSSPIGGRLGESTSSDRTINPLAQRPRGHRRWRRMCPSLLRSLTQTCTFTVFPFTSTVFSRKSIPGEGENDDTHIKTKQTKPIGERVL